MSGCGWLLLIVALAVLGDSLRALRSDRSGCPSPGCCRRSSFSPGLSSGWAPTRWGATCSRNIIAGTRLTLFIGAVGTAIGLAIGVASAWWAGYYGGGVDRLAMRLSEAQTAMPMFLVAIFFLTVLGPTVLNVLIILPALVWPAFARLVRAETLRLREAAVRRGCCRDGLHALERSCGHTSCRTWRRASPSSPSSRSATSCWPRRG